MGKASATSSTLPVLGAAEVGTFVGSLLHAGVQVSQQQREHRAGERPNELTLRLGIGVLNSVLALVLARLMTNDRRVAFVGGAMLSALVNDRFDQHLLMIVRHQLNGRSQAGSVGMRANTTTDK